MTDALFAGLIALVLMVAFALTRGVVRRDWTPTYPVDVTSPGSSPPARCECGLLTLYRELVEDRDGWQEVAGRYEGDLAYIARIAATALGQQCHDARPREAVEQLCAAYGEAGRGH